MDRNIKRENATGAEPGINIPTPSEEDLKPKIRYMDNIIRVLETVHMWPNRKHMNFFHYHSLIWIITAIFFTQIIISGITIVQKLKNLDSIAFKMDAVVGTMFAIFRYLYVYKSGDKYVSLVTHVHNNFIHYSLFPKPGRASIMPYYNFGNKLCFLFCFFTMVWMFELCSLPFVLYLWNIYHAPSDLNETHVELIPYPGGFQVYAPFDYNRQPGNAIFYAYEYFFFMLLAWVYVVADNYWYMIILLTIGQFDLLKDSVNTIAEILCEEDLKEGYRVLSTNELEKVEDALKRCIRQHQYTREFVAFLNDISSINMLLVTFHTVVSMGFLLLEITVAIILRDWVRFSYCFGYFVALLSNIFAYNWLGTQLNSKETEVADALSLIPWYRCPKLKPLIIVMSIQARRPSHLTGGKLYKLSLGLFISVMQVAFSYFSFFLQVRSSTSD